VLGKKHTLQLTEEQRQAAQPVIPEHAVAAKYLRIRKGHDVFYSQEYMRTKTRNSYTVLLENGQFAVVLIMYLLKVLQWPWLRFW